MTHKRNLLIIVAGLLLVIVLLAGAPAQSQEVETAVPEPGADAAPEPAHTLGTPPPAPGAVQLENGRWVMTAAAPETKEPAVPAATGGPDDYGYVWNDGVAMSWIDARDGTNSGLSHGSYGAAITSAIPLGFDFPFYEYWYDSIYISSAGSAGFDRDSLAYRSYTPGIPSPDRPNNFIAAFFEDLQFNAPGAGGAVYYLRGGSAPNRYFVIQWHNVGDQDGGRYTFQIVLYENGNIRLQYQQMDYGDYYYCNIPTGIEGPLGIDGLNYFGPGFACNNPELLEGRAILFQRPAPAARVQLYPDHYGTHLAPGESATVEMQLKNTGNVGSDRYDFAVPAGWSLDLYHADGVTALTDTNGNSLPDTGLMDQNQEKTVVAVVQAPATAAVGDYQTFNVAVRSALNAGESEIAMVRAAVPAPFAQVYRNNQDAGAMGFYLAHPAGQWETTVGPEGQYGFDTAVAETPDHNFVYVWSAGRCADSSCHVYVGELYYTILDRFGRHVIPVRRLTDLSAATLRTHDYDPAVAVTADGRIGIAWYRYRYNQADGSYNYNFYFAALSRSGSVAGGPHNVTNNPAWGFSSTLGVPRFYDPQLVPVAANRFLLAWERQQLGPPAGDCNAYCYVEDIIFAVYGANGTLVRPATPFTADTAGWHDGYSDPTLVPLSGDRTLLGFARRGDYNDLYYALLGSDGSTLQPMVPLTSDGADTQENRPAGVQLDNGNVVLGWTAYDWGRHPRNGLGYAVLNAGLARIGGESFVLTPGALEGISGVSVTRDGASRAILTWQGSSSYYRHLYYMLLGASGNVVTPATIFRTDDDINPYLETSYTGYGNTTYTYEPPAVDGIVEVGAKLTGAVPGGVGKVEVEVLNGGQAELTGAVLSATLPANVTYLSDNSGLTPTVSGNTVSWDIPTLSYLVRGDFSIAVDLPDDGQVGDRYPIAFTLTTAAEDADPDNNSATAEIMAAHQVMLPTLRSR